MTLSDRTERKAMPVFVPKNLTTSRNGDYEFLDCGEYSRLERFGEHVIERPSPQSFWPRSSKCGHWTGKHSLFKRKGSGAGEWLGPVLPGEFDIEVAGLAMRLKPTPFGHLGFFPEHLPQVSCIVEHTPSGANNNLLNLFGYTGLLSMSAAAAGWQVTHLDASKGAVQWAKTNARLNDVEGIRWITDDSIKFCKRELRRGHRYKAVVLDPPSFGRGSQGQVFKLERDLPGLVHLCSSLLEPDAAAMVITCHTPGVTGSSLANLLAPLARKRGGRIEHGEQLLVSPRTGNTLPCGCYGRWIADACKTVYREKRSQG